MSKQAGKQTSKQTKPSRLGQSGKDASSQATSQHASQQQAGRQAAEKNCPDITVEMHPGDGKQLIYGNIPVKSNSSKIICMYICIYKICTAWYI